MRIKGDKKDISYDKTKTFFEHRIKKYTENNPYSVTMYQDKHPELIKSRNENEISIILPKLKLDFDSRVLDVACGIGRWSDAIDTLFQIERLCSEKTIIIIREPIGIESRLTLEEQYSDELEEEYNAIYRTRDELVEIISEPLLNKGFYIEEESFLFEQEGLNNRKETRQYFFVLKRK